MIKISIIIITYNRANYIVEAINSVLEQSFNDWELLIIDSSSIDSTKEIVGEYQEQNSRIRYINTEYKGISEKRNLGLKLATGKYVAVLDSDDVWIDRDKLQKQYKFLEGHGEHALIGGLPILIDDGGDEINKRQYSLTDNSIRQDILLRNHFVHSSVLYNKERIVSVGGYDNGLKLGEDYDLWLKLGRKWKFANLDDFLIKYRVHSGNVESSNHKKVLIDTFKIIKRYKKDYKGYLKAMIKHYLVLWRFIILKK